MTKTKNTFDILVVGAGPGGAVASKFAAKKGFKTCLLEKKRLGEEGRYKACGGALDWKLIEKIDYPKEKIERVIETLVIHHIDGTVYYKKGKGAVIWRSTFDRQLVQEAEDEGALVKEQEFLKKIEQNDKSYTVMTNKEKYEARFVICADGSPSLTLRKLKWPEISKKDIVVTITEERKQSKEKIKDDLGEDTIHLFFGIHNFIPVGYAWLFPKTDIITTGWGNLLPAIDDSKKEFLRFINHPFVKKSLKGTAIVRRKGHLIPVGLRPLLCKDNVFAIGDAGGLVDPISGKGIPYAMLSGMIAVETIEKYGMDNQPAILSDYYVNRLNSEFLDIFRKKKIMRDIIFQNDENLKEFLSLWEKYRSSEIAKRGIMNKKQVTKEL